MSIIKTSIICLICGLSGLAYQPVMSFAQEAQLAIPAEEFAEGYTGQANVSSAGVLVGLSIGADTVWSVDYVEVMLPRIAQNRMCLRTSSIDGRFWSENPYLSTGDAHTASLGPLSRQYTQILKTMPSDQLAIRVAVPPLGDCDDLSLAQYLPVLGKNGHELVVHINSGDRRAVTRLVRTGKALSENIECNPIESAARVAADRLCRIPLPETPGDAELQLALIGISGTPETMSFNVYLPPYPSETP